jgi:galactokinase
MKFSSEGIMPKAEEWVTFINSRDGGAVLEELYGRRPEVVRQQQARYQALVEQFQALYPGEAGIELFSSPGRTEIGGNHTDHNGGRVLAAAVNLDIIAAAAPTSDGLIRIQSAGYPAIEIDTRQLEPVEGERFTSAALGRGVCAALAQQGYPVGGFRACLATTVPKGGGLSSSAAFELLVAVILNELYNHGRAAPLALALAGYYAERQYFGKPSGLMDQATIATGGFVTIDFKDFSLSSGQDAPAPLVRKVRYDLASSGYNLVIVETGGDHASLTGEYTAIAGEMQAVAQALGGKLLRQFSRQKLLEALPTLRPRLGDRALLRALHFYADDQRVVEEVEALEGGRFETFLHLVNESGRSSWMLLQNCYSPDDPLHQGIALAQALSELKLGSRGAWRVHGGGFGGTIQVFLPADQLSDYVSSMEAIFGRGACHPVLVRRAGATRILLAKLSDQRL